jgi:O-6-methylguanine DNA methyltransferase
MKKKDMTIKEALESGTPFQRKVWSQMLKTPKGRVVTYSELAKRIGNPRAIRAVASACKRNPLPEVIPCFRLVPKRGIGRYSGPGGIKRKRELLRKEGIVI